MSAGPRTVAYFARGIDGFYLFEENSIRGIALVRDDTPEAAWAEQFLPADECLRYRVGTTNDPIYPTTEEILRGGNLAELLAARGIRDLLLSSAMSPAIQQWSVDHGIRLWAADYEHQIRLENKLWFDQFLKRHAIPHPSGFVVTIGEPPRPAEGWVLDRSIVVQRAESLGGEGTYFLPSLDALTGWAIAENIPTGECCLVRERIDGHAFGITLLVAPQFISLSAIRQQCYYPSDRKATQTFAGIQWLPMNSIGPAVAGRIEDVFLRLGRQLHKMGFFGLANCDFLIGANQQVLVIECNPRMSAATPQLFLHPSLGGETSIAKMFLQGFERSGTFAEVPREAGLPTTDFAGATLDVVPSTAEPSPAVLRDFPSGTYRLTSTRFEYIRPEVRWAKGVDEFCLFSFATAGQSIAAGTTLATILANFRLYDAGGTLSTEGQQLLNHIRFD